MSRYFKIASWYFYPQKNEVHNGNEIIKVRPKTSELLTVLLEANGQIVSKSELLQEVWNDVIVEEHVIFQSITELRKIFGDTRVIKTHPRKGYSVSVPITKQTYTHNCGEASQVNSPSNTQLKTRPVRRFVYAIIALALVLVTFLTIQNHFDDKEPHADAGAIIVLPVNNRIMGSEYKWVRYGAMDHLIDNLQYQVKPLVLPTEMVLDTIKRANLAIDNFEEDDIKPLFEVSGANVIITQSIAGFNGEFQLVYRVYKANDVSRGVVFADDLNTLLSDFQTLMLTSLGAKQRKVPSNYQRNFTNTLMASAIDEFQIGGYEKAATMFQAVLVTEPENLLAIKMLVKSYIYLGEYVQAEKIAKNAVKFTEKNGELKNLGRLYVWQAISVIQQNKYEQALLLLDKAKPLSQETNDHLYLANNARIAAKAHLKLTNYEQSRKEIAKALSFYEAIREPYGQSSIYIDLGELELALNNIEQAIVAFTKALELATQSRLTQLIDISNEWLQKTSEASTNL
ncbi:winged helix-turn-helix domain-containing protein [Pseudoalteromonas sp. MMG022]|uniref:winged helix-turn-helix domain-containing protein n=1 Tax=Pseudoalteromonas sp. MMG022 TaxID=2909978 RepID=UPI001EFF89B1|nr:winged helix-turn-helix domain-containing protein [Pseudoalteromonas sp. MMG022]MCF6437218.1 winged helix-turn-helix domain-containing protein [Pseudoalteromonas sp. MMG022]